MADRFTLRHRKWYAMEYLADSGQSLFELYSPIYVFDIQPMKSGSGRLEIEFWHLNYSAGAQRKRYRLAVLKRANNYLVAERIDASGPVPTIVLKNVSIAWYRKHFPGHVRDGDESIATVLARHDIETE